MQFGRSLWAVSVLAILSTPVAALTGFSEPDREPGLAPASFSLSSANTVAVYVSGPGVEGPPALAGLTMETFDNRLACPGSTTLTTGTPLAVGTLSARTLGLGCAGAATTSAEAMPHTQASGSDYPTADRSVHAWPTGGVSSGSPATITLQRPANYLGVYWFFGNSGDQFVLASQGTPVVSFSTVDLMSLIPLGGSGTVNAIGGGTYQQNHYLGGRKAFGNGSNTEPAVYLQFVAPPGVAFDEVRLSAGNLEFDNLAIANYSGAFPTNGLVGVALSGASSAPVITPTFKEVTFDANGGGAANATQSALSGTSDLLDNNSFTRPGYSFAGWNTAADGSGTSYADGAAFPFTTNTTLYAQWTEVPAPGNGPQLPLVTLPVATVPPSTTTPSTTTAPSTAPPSTTTVPVPVPDAAGELPTMQPGESLITDNGNPVPVDVFLDDSSTLVMRGQNFQLNLTGDCTDGCTVISDQTGRETIELEQDGNALVDGFGFMPGTLVHIWMFSEPTYLGSLTVADDGTFQGSVYLQGIAPGTHTLQVNGTSFDGNNRSANLGVVVAASATNPDGPLPATGGGNNAPLLAFTALAMIMLGALARRRA